MLPSRRRRSGTRRPRAGLSGSACGGLLAAAAVIASVVGYGTRGASAFMTPRLSSSPLPPPQGRAAGQRLAHRPPRPWPTLLAHDHHEHEHEHKHERGDPVPLVLLAGPPVPSTATMDALQAILEEHQRRQGKLPLGVVLAGTGGVSDRLLALQEAQASSCGDDGCFVLYSLKHVDPGPEAAAGRIQEAAIELIEEQGPFSAVLLVVPPSLDVLAAAEVLTGHGHDHEEDEDDGDHQHHHHHHDGCEHCGASSVARLQRVVVAVDAGSLLTEWRAADGLAERGLLAVAQGEEEDEKDYRTVADVLCSQIETADTLILAGGQEQQQEASVVASFLRRLKPSARVLSLSLDSDREALHASVAAAPHAAAGPGFDVHEAENGAGWLQLLNTDGEDDDDAPQDEHTWATVYRRRRPFHPQRLWDFVTRAGGPVEASVLRSKGFFWLASRHDGMGLWSQAGGAFAPEAAGAWWCVTPEDEWPDEEEGEEVRGDFDADGGPYGDRRQEVAFVGLRGGGGKEALVAGLDACLLTDQEMGLGPDAWEGFEDPFPEW